MTPLMYGVVSGSVDLLKLLLAHGAYVNARDPVGFTPLMAAAGGGLVNVMRVLLDGGASVNAKSNDGTSALQLAIRTNHPEAEKLLREKGAE